MALPSERPAFPSKTRRMAVFVNPAINWVTVEAEPGTDIYALALDQAEKHIPRLAGEAESIAIVPADAILEYRRGWISAREVGFVAGYTPVADLVPHPFEGVALGVADRPCTRCHRPDRDPIHDLSKV